MKDNLKNIIKQINFNELEFLKVGSITDNINKTGVTVLYFDEHALAGCDISGGGPASRETPITLSETTPTPINAIVLSGGSAFGLAASDGVMQFLEEKNLGLKIDESIKVPIVLQSCIFDLQYGSSKIRPGPKMGYDSCKLAFENNNNKMQDEIQKNIENCNICRNIDPKNDLICNNCLPINLKSGNYGGGTGATVSKIRGMKFARKSGIGFSAYELKCEEKTLKLGAIVILNALGDIYDRNNNLLLGLRNDNNAKNNKKSEYEILNVDFGDDSTKISGNTTIGAIITNANFNKGELNKIASMTRSAYSQCIKPVGTTLDGDTIYAVSTGKKEDKIDININKVGALATIAMKTAIENAAKYSDISDEEYFSNIKV